MVFESEYSQVTYDKNTFNSVLRFTFETYLNEPKTNVQIASFYCVVIHSVMLRHLHETKGDYDKR